MSLKGGIAIDSTSKVVYWFGAGNSLMMTSLDGRINKTIIKGIIKDPRDIVLYEEKGLLFFSDYGNSRIIRIQLDTSKKHYFTVYRYLYKPVFGFTFYKRKVGTKATGLAIDKTENKLYFCDNNVATIESVNLDFTNHQVIYHKTEYSRGHFFLRPKQGEVVEPFNIYVFGEEIFWTDLHHRAIFSANKWTGTNIKYITGGLGSPKDLHVFSSASKGGKSSFFLQTCATTFLRLSSHLKNRDKRSPELGL